MAKSENVVAPVPESRFTRRDDNRSARLYVGSSEQMTEVADESVALTVTSPPYWNAIDYDRHASTPEASYRTRSYSSGFQTYESYLDWVQRIFKETFRKTKPGGFLAVVIGTVLLEGKHFPVPFNLTGRLVQDGWLFHQDVVWHKTTAGVKRAGVFIQHPYPGYFYPNIMTEYIMLFRRPGPAIYRTASPEQREGSKVPISTLFTTEMANTVWHIAPVPPKLLAHPAPFPEEIPFRLIQLYSYPGDLILDPFLGSGQTTKVAWALGRNSVGYDIVDQYVAYAGRRLEEPLSVRPMQLYAKFLKMPVDAPAGCVLRLSDKTRHGSGLRSKKRRG